MTEPQPPGKYRMTVEVLVDDRGVLFPHDTAQMHMAYWWADCGATFAGLDGPSSTEDTPAAPEPRVWQKLDDEPDESVCALAQIEGAYWPFVRRAPFGGWYFSSEASGPNTTGVGSPWHWVLSRAEGPLSEVASPGTTGEPA